MIGGRVALLLGLFVAPAVLLAIGHRLRDRSVRARRRFWGGVTGHLVGIVVSVTAMMAPPIWWMGGSAARDVAVHWSMLAGFLVGVLLGPWLSRTARIAPSRR